VTDPAGFPGGDHDHSFCVAEALDAAERLCRERGERLTPLRRRVLEIVWSDHRPSGAYAVLDRLAGDGGRPAPPTVYRALDFLRAQGLVHRVESRNAFVGCPRPEGRHAAQLLICSGCGRAAELDDTGIRKAIRAACDEFAFNPEHSAVEIEGVCAACSAGAPV
jgi:Fur family zinc uptake transcriptional regulator